MRFKVVEYIDLHLMNAVKDFKHEYVHGTLLMSDLGLWFGKVSMQHDACILANM